MAVCGIGGGIAAMLPPCTNTLLLLPSGGGAGEVAPPLDGIAPPLALHDDSDETVEITDVQSDTGLGQLAGDI